MNLGWWIAGQVTPNDQPTRGTTATYNGDAIGNVNGGRPGTYVATGDMNMGWDFGKRTGLLTISASTRP